MQISEPEPQDLDPDEIEEEDYYMADDCYDGNDYDEDEYEFDEADFNQHFADKFDCMDLPPGVEATVPWLQKIGPNEEDEEPTYVNTADENTKKINQFKQFDTVQNFSDHHFSQHSLGEVTCRISYSCFVLCLDTYKPSCTHYF
jgi:ubiquitin-conjugating enzyme E2 O